MLYLKARNMSCTDEYLRSDSAAQQFEIPTLQGMRTLWQNGLQCAIHGQTSLEETVRVLAADMI